MTIVIVLPPVEIDIDYLNNNNRHYIPPRANSLDEVDEFRAEALFSTISSSTISSSDSFDMNNESRWNSDMSGGAVGAYILKKTDRTQPPSLVPGDGSFMSFGSSTRNHF